MWFPTATDTAETSVVKAWGNCRRECGKILRARGTGCFWVTVSLYGSEVSNMKSQAHDCMNKASIMTKPV